MRNLVAVLVIGLLIVSCGENKKYTKFAVAAGERTCPEAFYPAYELAATAVKDTEAKTLELQQKSPDSAAYAPFEQDLNTSYVMTSKACQEVRKFAYKKCDIVDEEGKIHEFRMSDINEACKLADQKVKEQEARKKKEAEENKKQQATAVPK